MNGDETLKKQESHKFIHGSVNTAVHQPQSLLDRRGGYFQGFYWDIGEKLEERTEL
jgi:hypothetical protein